MFFRFGIRFKAFFTLCSNVFIVLYQKLKLDLTGSTIDGASKKFSTAGTGIIGSLFLRHGEWDDGENIGRQKQSAWDQRQLVHLCCRTLIDRADDDAPVVMAIEVTVQRSLAISNQLALLSIDFKLKNRWTLQKLFI